jgi:hypothetical protein
MKSGGQLALALAAGYMLGRRRKTRLAIMLGTAALTGRLGGATGQLMRSGTKLLGSSDLGKVTGDALGEAAGKAAPGLGEVGDMIRQDLTSVVKRAAATAISKQIESLSDQLRDRAEAIREQAADSAKETGEEAEGTGDGKPTARRRGPVPRQRVPRQRDERAEDEELAEAEDEEPAERAPRSGAASRSAASRGGAALRSGARSGRPARPTPPIRRTQR